MGSWNQTCGLSTMPIRAGEAVAAILLRKNGQTSGANGTSYCDELWQPVGLPLFGVYDDYGMVTDIDDNSPGAKVLIAFANRKKIVPEPYDNSHWPGVADRIVQRIDDISREAKDYDDWGFSIMMISKPIYDAALGCVHSQKNWRGGFVGQNFLTMLTDYVTKMAELKELYATLENDEEKELFWFRKTLGRWEGDLGYYLRDNRANDEIYRGLENDPEQFIAAIMHVLLLKSVMEWSRKTFMPQSGQGSQDDDTEVQVAIAHATIQLDLDRKAAWEREYGEDADDDNESEDDNDD